jgi:hypothetical protein
MAARVAVAIVKDNLGQVISNIGKLTTRQVLIGVPAENAEREDATGKYSAFNNAAIGYVSEFGSPARNIPARPHLVPGIKAVAGQLANILKAAATAALDGKPDEIDTAFKKAGILAVGSVQKIILAGIPPGLATATLKARARRAGKGTGVSLSKGAKAELLFRADHPDAGASITSTTPLVDTSAYIHSITYVLRDKPTGKPPAVVKPVIKSLTVPNLTTPPGA